jgi:hypothetical protein
MANEMSNEAARVFAETAFYTGIGIQREMDQRKFVLTDEARDYWLDRHEETIPRALKSPATNWERDRAPVIEQAINLGIYAAQFAIADHHGAGPVEITREHVERASQKVNSLNICGYCMVVQQ